MITSSSISGGSDSFFYFFSFFFGRPFIQVSYTSCHVGCELYPTCLFHNGFYTIFFWYPSPPTPSRSKQNRAGQTWRGRRKKNILRGNIYASCAGRVYMLTIESSTEMRCKKLINCTQSSKNPKTPNPQP